MAKKGLVFDDLTLMKNLAASDERLQSAMTAFTHFWSPRVESHARQHAPWRDRTGNARQGLRATPEIEPPARYAIVLFHRVPYGIWLEVRWNGRYAIIMPTVRRMGPEVMDGVRRLLGMMN